MASPPRPNSRRPGAYAPPADGVPAHIMALRPASGHERAELIRDVIDAFRRLRESLYRLNCLLAPEADCTAAGTSLLPLLAGLAPHTGSAGAARLRERKHAIRDTRRLDKTRDALFSDTFCRDTEAMR